MKNWKMSPANKQVAQYVECYWFLEKEPNDTGSDHPKLYPDPSAHLLIAAADYRYQYQYEDHCFSGYGCHVLYPHRNTLVMDHSEPFLVLGIKLKIGALYSLKKGLEPKISDQIIEADLIKTFDNELFDAEVLLAKCAASPQEVCSVLDVLLMRWVDGSLEDRQSKLVRRVLPLLGGVPVGELGSALHCSQRTLERNFLKVTGLTLKQCQSMLRFENILDYLHEKEASSIDWLSVAFEFGFSDQPHLIRHLKRSIGVTPNEYAEQRDLTIDIYGNFELD